MSVTPSRGLTDPFPHPALRGGVLPRLLSFVGWAMAIAQLTHLHISIPASGAAPGQVPEQCFPCGMPSRGLTDPRRVSFASDVTVLGGEPPVEKSPDILIHDPVCPEIAEEDEMDIVSAETDVPIPVLRPPPGFRHFSWPREEWGPDGDPSLTFQRSSLAGFLGDLGDSRLIRRRCRFRQYFRIAWTIRLLLMWVRPERSRALHPRPLSSHRLSWTLFRSEWILMPGWIRHRPMLSDHSRGRRWELSPIYWNI